MTPHTPMLGVLALQPIVDQSDLFDAVHARGNVRPRILYLCHDDGGTGYDPEFDSAVATVDKLPTLTPYQYYPHLLPPHPSPQLENHYRPSLIDRALPRIARGSVATLHFTRALRRWIRQESIDTVLLHGYSDPRMFLSSLLLRSWRIPYIARGVSQLETTASGPRKVMRTAVAHTWVRGASAAVYIGSANRRFYEHFGAPPLFFSPYAVSQDRVRPPTDHSLHRQLRLRELGLPDAAPVVLFIGKLQPWKRPLDLIEALRLIDRDIALIFIGDGPQRLMLQIAAQDLPVAFAGYQPPRALATWLALGDVLALPSSREQWGLVVNEAMSAGLVPVTSEAVGSAHDLVRGTGEVHPVGDISRLAQALTLVTRPHELHRRKSLVSDRMNTFSLDMAAHGVEQATLEVTPPPQPDP